MSSFVSHKYRLIFCHVPRTGGTSFTEAIKPYLGPHDELDTYEKHTALRNMQEGRLSEEFKRYLKVAIWRDDKDRMASLSNIAEQQKLDLKETDAFWWSNEMWLCDEAGNMLANELIMFDELPESLWVISLIRDGSLS